MAAIRLTNDLLKRANRAATVAIKRAMARPQPRDTISHGSRAATPHSAALAYRWRTHQPEIALVTSRNTKRWVLPKGNIEPGMTPSESAGKEAFEEAGVIGTMAAESIGTYTHAKSDGSKNRRCRVQVFPLLVTAVCRDWPERRERTRLWMTLDNAAARVNEPDLKRLLKAFRCDLERHRK